MFAPELVDRIDRLLNPSSRFPCVLLVHRDIRTLNAARDNLLACSTWHPLSVAGAICEQLVPIAPARRGEAAQSMLAQVIASAKAGPLLVDAIDILFEPSLQIDPLVILRNCSRSNPLIVLWPGDFVGNVLSYAVPEHGHYRRWTRNDLCDRCVIPL